MLELPVWLPQFGAGGLLLVVCWLVVTGRLVPRPTHNEVRSDRDTYRKAAETALLAAAEASAHVGRLVSTVEQLTAAQRETLELVRRLVPPTPAPTDRSAA